MLIKSQDLTHYVIDPGHTDMILQAFILISWDSCYSLTSKMTYLVPEEPVLSHT